ncbi:hypothetical protein C8R46DRAFT_490955 [Mycena filopes]|nr:hypothetical protein C8R46DRAFT_490955 [Mycena filopes]
MATQGNHLREMFDSSFPVPRLNFTMEVGGSGSLTQYDPAWTATIVGYSMRNDSGLQTVGTNLAAGSSEVTGNLTKRILSPARRQSSGGFSALQTVAQGMPSVQSNKNSIAVHDEVLVAAAAAPSPKFSSPDSSVLNVTLAPTEGLILLSVKEGMWADGRDAYIKAARSYNPDIANKYFGAPKTFGEGPIGRRWTHLVLRVSLTPKNGTQEASTAELIGKVFEVIAP